MRLKTIVLLILVLKILSAFGSDDSLKLASQENIILNLILEKSVLLTDEPIVTRCYIINTANHAVKINFLYGREDAMACGYTSFSAIGSDGKNFYYKLIGHGDRLFEYRNKPANDTTYFNVTLWPRLFRNTKDQKPGLPPGRYKLCIRLCLGHQSHVYDTVDFKITKHVEKNRQFEEVLPVITCFYGNHEEGGYIYPVYVLKKDPNRLLKNLDSLRKSNFYLSDYIDYVYIMFLYRSLHLTDRKPDKAIKEAVRFIKQHAGSILAEEMEYHLIRMERKRDRDGEDWRKRAVGILEKYPKNLNNVLIRRLLKAK